MQRSVLIVSILLLGTLPAPADAAYFGKNKVRARELAWSVLETPHFEVHYYAGEEAAADAAVAMAEEAYARLARTLRHEIARKVPIILYASHSDFQETNITPELIDTGTAGITEFQRRRVFLPFTGSYADLRHVLTHELVHAFQIDILFGGAGGPRMNPFSLRVPLWMMEGMAEYLSLGGTDSQTSMWLSDACHSGRLLPLEDLGRVFDIRVYRHGQAIWAAIAREHGDGACGDVLRAIVAEGNEAKGIEKALGVSLEDLSEKWVAETHREFLPRIAEKRRPSEYGRRLAGGTGREPLALSPAISPDGRRFAYFSNRDLSLALYVGEIESGEVERVVEQASSGDLEELRLFHSSIAWSPDGGTLAFAAKGVGEEALVLYDLAKRRADRRVLVGLDEVRSPSFSPDGRTLAVVGVTAARSDIYLYHLESGRVERVTNDAFAERSPAFSPDGGRIAFTTDRAEGAGRGPRFGPDRLALLDLATRETRLLPAVGARAASPVWDARGESILFTADPNGVPDIFVVRPATGEVLRTTRVLTGVSGLLPTSSCLSISADGRWLLFTALERGSFGIYLADAIQDGAEPFHPGIDVAAGAGGGASADGERRPPKPAPPARDTSGAESDTTQQSRDRSDWRRSYDPDIYDEETIYAGAAPREPAAVAGLASDARGAEGADAAPITPTRRAYKPRFAPDLALGGGAISTSGFGFGESHITLSDLLGNQRIHLGLGIYGSFENSDVVLGYEDLSGRNEIGYTLFSHRSRYRRSPTRVFLSPDTEFLAGGSVEVRRPISRYTRFETSLALGVMNDAYRTRSYAVEASQDPDETYRFARAGVAFVNDTVHWGRTGPVRGRRLRLSTEATVGDLRTVTFRADLRRYWPVTRDVTLAGRVVAGYRTGHLAERFHLGETTLVHGLRYGELIGTRMAVANVEARFPFVRTLALGFPVPIRIDEIGGALFVDAGAAWTSDFTNGGADADRALLDGNLLGAYGAGIRSNLAFLILKLDVAQRTNFSTRIGKPIVIATFGAEF